MRRGCTSEGVGGGRSGEGASGDGQRSGAAAGSGAQGAPEGRGGRCTWRRGRRGGAARGGGGGWLLGLKPRAGTTGLPAPVPLGRRAHTVRGALKLPWGRARMHRAAGGEGACLSHRRRLLKEKE
jgi:hypothetical protein